MQDAFEKIISKINEKIEHYDSRHKILTDSGMFGEADRIAERMAELDFAKEIVKQEAEKLGTDTNVGSNGWILVSESLPCESGYYLVTYHKWSNGDYLPEFDDTYVRRLHYQRSKHFVGWNYPHCVDERAEADTNREVIAWRKLPTPYQPKGE